MKTIVKTMKDYSPDNEDYSKDYSHDYVDYGEHYSKDYSLDLIYKGRANPYICVISNKIFIPLLTTEQR